MTAPLLGCGLMLSSLKYLNGSCLFVPTCMYFPDNDSPSCHLTPLWHVFRHNWFCRFSVLFPRSPTLPGLRQPVTAIAKYGSIMFTPSITTPHRGQFPTASMHGCFCLIRGVLRPALPTWPSMRSSSWFATPPSQSSPLRTLNVIISLTISPALEVKLGLL